MIQNLKSHDTPIKLLNNILNLYKIFRIFILWMIKR